MKWLSAAEDGGGNIRSFQLGRALSSFALVDAVGFVPGREVEHDGEGLAHYERIYPVALCRGPQAAVHFLSAFAGGTSLRTARFFPGKFGAAVADILRENHYDAVQVEELPMMCALSALSPDIPVVYSSYNLESELSGRLFRGRNPLFRAMAELEYWRTLREEVAALSRSAACLAVSDRDRDSLRHLAAGGGCPIHVLPNCAPDRFVPSPSAGSDGVLLFVGSFGWYPNREGLLWFVQEVLPVLRKGAPAVRVMAVGSGLGPHLRRTLEENGIEARTDVLDILPFFHGARLLFVPLRIGGGTRIKILEAWAAGLPVVSTTLGAEGLPCRPGADILLADDAAGFAAGILRLLQDHGLCRALRDEGLKRAQDFRWSGLGPRLQEVYQQLFAEQRMRP
jgi:glycosyltransferase involved in cell wall biosynthesis